MNRQLALHMEAMLLEVHQAQQLRAGYEETLTQAKYRERLLAQGS
jgi:hypothetical protein